MKPRDSYQLGANMTVDDDDDDDESYPQCAPPNMSKEDEFRDIAN